MRTTENRRINEQFLDGKKTVKVVECTPITKDNLRNIMVECHHCVYKNDCARGSKESELPARHLDCFGKYRADKVSVRFA